MLCLKHYCVITLCPLGFLVYTTLLIKKKKKIFVLRSLLVWAVVYVPNFSSLSLLGLVSFLDFGHL